jgi:hypothetical protein
MKEGSVLRRVEDNKLFTVTYLAHWSDIVSEDGEKDSVKWYGIADGVLELVGNSSGHSYRLFHN